MQTKKCRLCKTIKPVSEFPARKQAKDKLRNECRKCINKVRDKKVKKNYSYIYNYGIDQDDYNKLLEDQKGKCKICSIKLSGTSRHNKLCVDHDHSTGKVRGLLCHKCNTGLGLLGDSIENLEKAVEYLKGN